MLYTCGSPNHLARDCRALTTESGGKIPMVKADIECHKLRDFSEIAEYLFSSSIFLPASIRMSVIQGEITTLM